MNYSIRTYRAFISQTPTRGVYGEGFDPIK